MNDFFDVVGCRRTRSPHVQQRPGGIRLVTRVLRVTMQKLVVSFFSLIVAFLLVLQWQVRHI